MPPADQKTQAEAAVAKLLGEMEALQNHYTDMKGMVDELKKSNEGFEDIDFKEVVNRLEKQEAGFERIQKQIRSNRNGISVPGLEDENISKFSMLRAIAVVQYPKLRDSKDFGYEWEIMKQHREAVSKAQNVGIDSDGGFFVPDQMIADVIQKIYTKTNLISLDGEGTTLVSVLDGLTGSPVKIPKFNGGALAYWIGEEDEYVSSQANVGQLSMQPRKLGVLLELTEEMRKFQSFGLDALLRRDMIKAAAIKLDWTLLYGQGTDNAPRGVANLTDINQYSAELGDVYDVASLADAAGAELTFDDLDNMQGILEDNDYDQDESWRFVFPTRYARRLRQSKVSHFSGQTSEKGYLLGSPMLNEEQLATITGPFVKTTQIPTTNLPGETKGWATTSTDEEFGDVFAANWNEVLFGRWGTGIEIETGQSDDDFVRDKGKIKLRLYGDVGHRQTAGIVMCPDARMRG